MLYPLIRPLLFAMPPEKAHDLTIRMAHLSPWLGRLSGSTLDRLLAVQVGQVQWAFPIGLAAGLDKNAEALPFFSQHGFGSIECGTITLRPQAGNPRPRIFRYTQEESLRNAMGFPNHGLESILPRLKSYMGAVPVGANIGQNKETNAEESIEEICLLFEALDSVVDYFVINVSSPNTPGLRALQEKTYLSELFAALNERRKGKDLYLKIAPDLEEAKVRELATLAAENRLTGLIATNTTIIPERGPGGVSGKLLCEKAKKIREIILSEALPLELVGVGGFSGPRDLFDFWYAGGKVAQIYTSYVYQGPSILENIKTEILSFLKKSNVMDLSSFFSLPLDSRRELIKDFLGK